MKKNIFKSGGFQSLLASLLCIVLGLFLGYLVLLLINPAGAGEAILTVIKNFMTYNRLLGMKSVLCLVKYNTSSAVNNILCHFITSVRRQAVHKHTVRL